MRTELCGAKPIVAAAWHRANVYPGEPSFVPNPAGGGDKTAGVLIFKALDGKGARNAILDILRSATHSQTRIDAVRDLFAMSWDGEDFEIQDG